MTISIDYISFDTNYIWIIKDGQDCVVVDPGQAAPVQTYLETHDLRLRAILCTHYHSDHIGGLEDLNQPALPIYGPAYEPIHLVNRPVKEGDQLHFFDEDIFVSDENVIWFTEEKIDVIKDIHDYLDKREEIGKRYNFIR